MHNSTRFERWLQVVSLLGCCLITSGGCQTWQSSSVLPGFTGKQGERQVLREARNDPFPSPADVGMKINEH